MKFKNTRTTKPLLAKDYLKGDLNITKLIDDAVEALEGITLRRSRAVICRSFQAVLITAGYSESAAFQIYREQVLAIEELNRNAY